MTKPPASIRIFRADARGTLLHRPNRFIVHAALPHGEARAHCPNPGRLIELMNPGRSIILEKNRGKARKTEWTLAAASYKGLTVPLYSARANTIAEKLVIPRLFPAARALKAEYTWGHSRFDWHFFQNDREIFLEVKACTLIEEGTAMFPDAPSLRAVKHLKELAELSDSRKNREGHVLFIIMNPHTRRFIPNLHTDPAFALTMKTLAGKLRFHAVSCQCTAQGILSLNRMDIPVHTDWTQGVEKDSGYWLLVMELAKKTEETKSLNLKQVFPPGWYVFSAFLSQGLGAWCRRLSGKGRKNQGLVGQLKPACSKLRVFPVYSEKNSGAKLAQALYRCSDQRLPCPPCPPHEQGLLNSFPAHPGVFRSPGTRTFQNLRAQRPV